MRLTTEQLDALEAALKAATPGEWDTHEEYYGVCGVTVNEERIITSEPRWNPNAENNHRLIALARNALPALLAAARATVPEVISDRHKNGNYWMVYLPDREAWIKCRWHGNGYWLIYGGYALDGTPTHALPLPPPMTEGTDGA
jgi:hypothetical protein